MGEDYKLSLRADNWKYIWDRDAEETELYNLEADPDETENLVAEQPDVADAYRQELTAHLEEIRETNEDLPTVEMDEETQRRLEDLGYLQ